MKEYKFDTKTVQAGYSPADGQARVPSIVQSTTFKYTNPQELADLFDLKTAGHFYTRLSNPSAEVLEKKMTALEGGIGAIASASGQSASTMLALTLCNCGDHILSIGNIYGGTYNLFNSSLPKLGIQVSFVDKDATEDEIYAKIQPNTKLLFGESLTNPSAKVLDIEKFARVAKKANIPFAVDNTFPTPALCRPFEFGANIVIHSLSKYADGHACSLGGIIVDKGDFDFSKSDRFPDFNTPDESYHGIVYARDFKEFAFLVKARTHIMRDMGMMISPMNAWLTNMNLETLALRMQRHSQNAQELAEFLEAHDKVDWVSYPALKSSKDNQLAKKYLKMCSGVLTFAVKGTKESAQKLMQNLELAALVIHVADNRTAVLHPASTTHRQLSQEQQISSGITDQMIRVSLGIEASSDIIADFENALSKI